MIITYCDVIRRDHCHHWMEVTQKRQLFNKLIIKSCRTMNSYYSISYIFMLILTSSLLQQQNLLICIEWVYIEFTRDVQLEYSGL